MAVKTIQANPDIKVILMDRTLSGDVSHLVWSVNELLDSDKCVLLGIETEFGMVSALDLELARMLHSNDVLNVPAPRSHLIKYSALGNLIKESANGITKFSYQEVLKKIGANEKRLGKLAKDMRKLNQRHSFLHYGDRGDDRKNRNTNTSDKLTINSDLQNYWNRVLSATIRLAEYIFNGAQDGIHPLLYEGVELENGNDIARTKRKKKWITADDLDYMALVMIYALLRLAWEKKVLVIDLIKDIGAAEMINTVVPILQNTGYLKLKTELPNFNSDKMLLQTASIINTHITRAPWKTFEFDACFRTIVPCSLESELLQQKKGEKKVARVVGSFKNVISAERMFFKSYIQLWW